MQEQWLNREFEDPSQHAWATKNAAALAIAGYVTTLANSLENIEEEEKDGE
jgi:hypothetical protein